MSGFDAIDLSQLPPPAVVETLEYEAILAALKYDLAARAPELASVLALESEPLVKLLEVVAYRELLLRARVNDAARAVMLATSTGSDLDHLAAFFGVVRAVVQPADPNANPPIPEILESDDRLRMRTQMALEGYTSAGPIGAYTFHALSASPQVKDVSVTSPTPGTVLVTVLSTESDGTPSASLLNTVSVALSAENVRPLCDTVQVAGPSITTYTVVASITTYAGPDSAAVLDAARAAVLAYADAHHRVGHDIMRSGLIAALHQPGVYSVTLTSPATDIVCTDTDVAYCSGVTLTHAGVAL